MCGEGRRVRALDDEMFRAIDVRTLLLRIVAPQYKDEILSFVVEFLDSSIGKLLPPSSLMTARRLRVYRQRRIKKEHALFCPAREIGIPIDRVPEVRFKLFENILQ